MISIFDMTKDDYRKLKEEIESSGMSIRQYCQEHSLNPNVVYHAFSGMKEQELSLTVIDVPDNSKRFEMSLHGVHIHIEYEDESVLRKAIKGLSHVFSSTSLALDVVTTLALPNLTPFLTIRRNGGVIVMCITQKTSQNFIQPDEFEKQNLNK